MQLQCNRKLCQFNNDQYCMWVSPLVSELDSHLFRHVPGWGLYIQLAKLYRTKYKVRGQAFNWHVYSGAIFTNPNIRFSFSNSSDPHLMSPIGAL